MRIAQCLEYPIQQHGGTEVLVRELIAGLAPRHEIILVSDDDTQSSRNSSVAQFLAGHFRWDSTALSPESEQAGNGGVRRVVNDAINRRLQPERLAAQLAEARVDLAHFHFGGNYGWGNRAFNLCPIVALAKRGVPCLSTNHGAFSITSGYCGEQRSLSFRLALFLPAWLSKQYVLSHLRCEVTVSQNDYRALRRWYPLMRGRFRQIYHSRLHGSPPSPQVKRTKDIICIGTIGPRKGQTFLAEAFCQIASRHPDWKLVLIGRASDDAMMERMHSLRDAHRLTERIVLLGNQPDAEVNRWLRTAAIFAMPSVAEGLGLSLQEALFNGCACVTSRAGGTQDLVQNEDNGLLVEAADVPALARALDRLMSDEKLRSRCSARGPDSVLEKGMTAEKMVEKYELLYQQIRAGERP